MRSLYRFLPFFAISMLLVPGLAAAVNCDSNCQYVWHGIFGFDLNWLNSPRDLFINIIIPSAAVFMIFLGVFRAIGIGRMMGNLDYGISIMVMLATLFTGWLGAINTYALAFMGQFAFWGFFAVFVVAGGLYFWGIGRTARGEARIGAEYLTQVGAIKKDLERLNVDLQKARNRAVNMKTSARSRRSAEDHAARIETQIRRRNEELQALNQTYRRMP